MHSVANRQTFYYRHLTVLNNGHRDFHYLLLFLAPLMNISYGHRRTSSCIYMRTVRPSR